MPVDVRKLVEAGVHFGHQKSRWNPKMLPYIWGMRHKTHLINIAKTATQMEKSAEFLKNIIMQGKQILLIGTKRAAQNIIKNAADTTKMPYVSHRWIGGTLSNYAQVKKSLTKLLHLEDVLKKSKEAQFYTKKELNTFQKMVDRLEQYVGGLRSFRFNDLGAVVVVDVDKERSAVLEAASMKIPVVALVDTNTDPSLVDFVIPANDDSSRSIEAIFSYLVSAMQNAVSEFEKIKTEKQVIAQASIEEKEDVADEEIVAAPFDTELSEEGVESQEKKKSQRASSTAVPKVKVVLAAKGSRMGKPATKGKKQEG